MSVTRSSSPPGCTTQTSTSSSRHTHAPHLGVARPRGGHSPVVQLGTFIRSSEHSDEYADTQDDPAQQDDDGRHGVGRRAEIPPHGPAAMRRLPVQRSVCRGCRAAPNRPRRPPGWLLLSQPHRHPRPGRCTTQPGRPGLPHAHAQVASQRGMAAGGLRLPARRRGHPWRPLLDAAHPHPHRPGRSHRARLPHRPLKRWPRAYSRAQASASNRNPFSCDQGPLTRG